MNEGSLIFLHLSDIHFKKNYSGDIFDLDSDLRNQLERDAIKMAKRFGGVSGILISGDIAYSGKKEEYDTAIEWLENKLCKKLNCPISNIWCVPGNHDVERATISNSMYLKNFHKDMRSQDTNDIDSKLLDYLQDQSASTIYLPISKYNDFANNYQCNIDEKKLWWQSDFPLNDGSTLRVRGINSTLISDDLDDDAASKLVVGRAQATTTVDDGVEYLIICHHPPSWLRDQDNIEEIWNTRVRVQLFGHKHKQNVYCHDTRSVIVTAGATHPDRRDPHWLPMYNFIEIWVSRNDNNRMININIYPRLWNVEEQGFIGEVKDGNDFKSYSIQIDPWEPPEPAIEKHDAIDESIAVNDRGETTKVDRKEEKKVNPINDPARMLTYRFLRLSFLKRMQIAQNLNLLLDEDKGVQDNELFQRLFNRAKQNTSLEKLWVEVERAHGNNVDQNPYLGR